MLKQAEGTLEPCRTPGTGAPGNCGGNPTPHGPDDPAPDPSGRPAARRGRDLVGVSATAWSRCRSGRACGRCCRISMRSGAGCRPAPISTAWRRPWFRGLLFALWSAAWPWAWVAAPAWMCDRRTCLALQGGLRLQRPAGGGLRHPAHGGCMKPCAGRSPPERRRIAAAAGEAPTRCLRRGMTARARPPGHFPPQRRVAIPIRD